MTPEQRLWWLQARSDWALFNHLRANGIAECHLLHYLQMSTEKLSKAYLWRAGHAPPRSHVGFVRFLRSLLDRRSAELNRIARILGFAHVSGFENWAISALPMVYAIQKIAPAEAGDSLNAEYPWPHLRPTETPVMYKFGLWNELAATGQGRKILQFIRNAIDQFDQFA